MERLGNGYGYVVYETATWGGGKQIMKLIDHSGSRIIRDRALVFMDAKMVGKIEPKSKQAEFMSTSSEKHTLSFLVENQGRINWVAPGTKGKVFLRLMNFMIHNEINNSTLLKDLNLKL